MIAIIVAVVAIVGVIAASVASAGGAVGASTAITAGSGATGLTGLVESIGANILNGIGAITGTTVTAAGSSLLVGSLAITLSTISIAASILGATTDIFYGGSPDNCESFYPTCAQTITIEKEEKDGTGKCIPEGSAQAAAGQQMLVCAQVKKCNTIQKYLCMPCSVKCTASFY
ncbi:hypothetical protein HYX04_03830 [Candidatus Woesearchaeota archaeon]|nr:hypothetical protein [Candidatus Woesearchaeota archaeon]